MIDQIFVRLHEIIVRFAGTLLPDWIVILIAILIPIVGIAIFGPVTMMYLTWFERKILARIQNRFGPNRVGKYGLLQPLADGIKMMTKEDIVPEGSDHFAHFIAPVGIVIPALLVFAVLPFGRNMTAVDLNIGILFFFALSGSTTVFIFTAAWASRNKFSLLGGMRSVAQMVSYEIPFILSAVPVLIVVGSFSLVQIVKAQEGFHWFVFTPWGIVGFVIFFLCSVAEVNRTPFDLPEAESEIIAGFHTEYSGMKFALFYMAEFMNVFTVSALVASVYLGGWQGPWLPSWLWFLIKTYALIFIMMWFRGTLPRLRVDQLMGFSWKFLLPLSLVNILTVCLWYVLPSPVNTAVSVVVLAVTILFLLKISRSDLPKKRIYRYAS